MNLGFFFLNLKITFHSRHADSSLLRCLAIACSYISMLQCHSRLISLFKWIEFCTSFHCVWNTMEAN
ncbi:hypothetical protein S83_067674 [Arachis hypogaea]|uniref:Uncharacterized protein n=1 Tax=Arachis hypogaea TaxID=3818 RepID=A0A444XUB0_ARAHY|nr:hypothetical protein Ahy_B09g099303 isoform B [Arachis hypogaea]